MLEVNGHRIIVGIDTSGSMDTKDCPNRTSRLNFVREKAVTFIGEAVKAAHNNEVDLLFFAATTSVTTVKNAAEADAAFAQHPAAGGTATDAVIHAAWQIALKTPAVPAMLFLVTDGHPNAGGDEIQGQKLVDQEIIHITKAMKNPEQFRIMILTVGDRDQDLAAWLQHLDAELGPAGAQFDIVGENNLMEIDFDEAATELIKSTTTDDEAQHGETQGKVTRHT